MIRHIVLFTLSGEDEFARAAQVKQLSNSLERLAAVIPGVRSLRVDADGSGADTHWHAALVTEHDSWEALAAYQAHPAHVRVLEEVMPTLAKDKAIVDYEL